MDKRLYFSWYFRRKLSDDIVTWIKVSSNIQNNTLFDLYKGKNLSNGKIQVFRRR